MKKILITVIFLFSAQTSMAALINDMQGCQALLTFLDQKLESLPSSYNKGDIKTVRKGLEAYDEYIQQEIITPGLLEYTAGDKSKAKDLQKQVDDYKASVVAQYHSRYPQEQLFMDYAIQLNNCAKKAVPAGNDLEALKLSLNTMVELMESN